MGLFKEPIIGSLKSKMAEIRRLEIDMTSLFDAKGGPIWIKFRRLVQNDISTAVMWSKSKPDVEFQYGGRSEPQRYAKDNRIAHLTARSDKSVAYVTNNKRLLDVLYC